MLSTRTSRSPRPRLALVSCALPLAAAALLAVPPGCREPLAAPLPAAHGPDAPPRRGGTLRLATIGDVRTLDPAGPTDGLAVQAEHLLFAGLVDIDDRGEVVPDLAERWSVDDGGRIYRFTLRPGVVMHDGAELTAADVKRSVERSLHPASPNPNASYFRNLAGFEDFTAGRAASLDGVTAEGRYLVSFRLKEPDATFPSMLAMHTLRPVCASGGDRAVDGWLPCGAGPFKLLPGDWVRGISLRLVRHDAYFRPDLPHLDAVEWSFNMQATAQRFRFEDGSLDVIGDLTQPDQARFLADPRWHGLGLRESDRSVLGEAMNTRIAPFDNVEIRRAVAAAIDREHYRLLKPGYVTVLTQPIPPAIPGFDPPPPGQRHDEAAALEHMRKAGYPYDPATGRGGWPAPIPYPLYDRGLLVFTAQLLQQDLARIGLRLDLRMMSWPAFLAVQGRAGGAAMSQGNWEMDYPDPSSILEPLFTTAAIGADTGYNAAFYSNPRVDGLVARARGEGDRARRTALYREAIAIICDEAPWAFAFSYHRYDVHQGYVRGLAPHPLLGLDLARAWIDRTPGETGAAPLGAGGRAWP